MEFTPCVMNLATGRINVPVGKPTTFELARELLERSYPLAWRACEAIPQPSHLVRAMTRRSSKWGSGKWGRV